MPFFLGEKKIAGLGINDKNYVVKETTFTDPYDLQQAYPNGDPAAYMIGENGAYSIFIWNEETLQWQEVGNFGPYGESMSGPRGFRGYGILYSTTTTTDKDGNEEISVFLTQQPFNNKEHIVTIKEAGRQAAEAQRKTDEETRISNETERQGNEAQRIAAEDQRVLMEQIRVQKQNEYAKNEQTRQTNEQGRVEAEQARVEAEQHRQLLVDGQMGQYFQNRLPIHTVTSSITTQPFKKFNVINYNNNFYECISDTEVPAGANLLDTTKFIFLYTINSDGAGNSGCLFMTEEEYNTQQAAGNLTEGTLYFVRQNK